MSRTRLLRTEAIAFGNEIRTCRGTQPAKRAQRHEPRFQPRRRETAEVLFDLRANLVG